MVVYYNGLGLKRKETNADVVCFITHDINEDK